MTRFTSVLVAAMVGGAPAVLAQTSPAVDKQPQVVREQAMAPARDVIPMRSTHGFIVDEFGTLYDSKGQPITPRRLTR